MSDPCLHAGEEADPIALAERVEDLEERADKHDRKWEDLTGPDGSLTRLLVRMSVMEVRVGIYAALGAGAAMAAPAAVRWLVGMAAPAARAAGLAP